MDAHNKKTALYQFVSSIDLVKAAEKEQRDEEEEEETEERRKTKEHKGLLTDT